MASDSSNFNNGPSSADDDSFSSPVVSSSPADSSRQSRRRRRRSSDFSTPPASRSRFAASSETTPTAPSNRTRHHAPPSPPSDPPPSSEAGGGDYDEDRPTYVWGTNISVNDVKKDIQTFLKNFRDESQQQRNSSSGSEYMTEGLYIETIRNILEMEGDSLDVDAGHVFDYDPNLYAKLVRYPLEVLAIFDIVLMEMLPNINPLFEKHIQTRIFNLRTSTCLRNLNPSDIERMVSIKGMIIRCSGIIPEIREAIFRCLICGYYTDPIPVEKGRISEPKLCMKEECQAKNSMSLVHNRCRFTDKQIVRLQETPDEIPEGGTPHTVSLLMNDQLVDARKPGDRVEVTGIYCAMSVRVGPTQRSVKSLFKTYIDCLQESLTSQECVINPIQ